MIIRCPIFENTFSIFGNLVLSFYLTCNFWGDHTTNKTKTMFSNKTKGNIWLILSFLSLVPITDRIIHMIDDSIGWWELCSAVVISVFCIKNYLCYRRQLKNTD